MSATAPTIDVDVIPAELRSLPQWVLWRLEARGGKPTKVPIRAADGKPAKSTDPADWVTFDEAMESSVESSGIGFVFAPGGGLVGIDIDGCIGADGRMEQWGRALLDRFPTYAEISPSGTGVKLWCRGQMPRKGGRRRSWRSGAVEMYEEARFFTVTSRRLDGAAEGIAECQAQITGLHALVFGDKPEAPPPPVTHVQPTADDQAIIDKLLGERGDKAARLWSGDTSGYLSASEADLGLCCKIAFYTGRDPARIESLFNQSGLIRGKWVEREFYRKATITAALQQVTTFYDWKLRPAGLPAHPGASPTSATITAPDDADADGLAQLLDDTISGKRRAIPWPWPALSRVTKALLPGTLTVLCGSAGSKKSMLMSQCCLHWLDRGVPFAVFHLEEDRAFHLHRALAQLARNAEILNDDRLRGSGDGARASLAEHRAVLDELAKRITDAPASLPKLSDLTDWVRDRAKAGARVLAIDPVTAADSGREPWLEDRKFVLETKAILREYGASLVLVTHPRSAGAKDVDRLDSLAGGKAFNRFTQTVLWIESVKPGKEYTVRANGAGMREAAKPDLVVHICKARNGCGHGWRAAYRFDSGALLADELGIVMEDDE